MAKLILVNSLDYGGLEKHVYSFVRNYPEKFIIVCLNKKGYLGKLLKKQGFEVVESGRGKLRKIKQIRRLIKENNVSLIISHNTVPMQLAVLSSLNMGVKRIHVDHNTFAEGTEKTSLIRFKTNLENRFFSKFIHQFITITPAIKEKIIQNWKVKKEKIKIIHNGIDLRDIDSDYGGYDRYNKSKKSNIKTISIISALRPVKDHFTLLRAFADIKSINARLLIVGDGELRDKIKQQISELGIQHKVRMLGVRRDILKLIGASNVVVCSSLNEGISFTLLEAMALSKPIIATNVGGNRIIVRKNGLLFKPRDYKTLSKHIKKVLEDEDYAKRLGSIGRKMVEDCFNVKNMVEEYKEVIF